MESKRIGLEIKYGPEIPDKKGKRNSPKERTLQIKTLDTIKVLATYRDKRDGRNGFETLLAAKDVAARRMETCNSVQEILDKTAEFILEKLNNRVCIRVVIDQKYLHFASAHCSKAKEEDRYFELSHQTIITHAANKMIPILDQDQYYTDLNPLSPKGTKDDGSIMTVPLSTEMDGIETLQATCCRFKDKEGKHYRAFTEFDLVLLREILLVARDACYRIRYRESKPLITEAGRVGRLSLLDYSHLQDLARLMDEGPIHRLAYLIPRKSANSVDPYPRLLPTNGIIGDSTAGIRHCQAAVLEEINEHIATNEFAIVTKNKKDGKLRIEYLKLDESPERSLNADDWPDDLSVLVVPLGVDMANHAGVLWIERQGPTPFIKDDQAIAAFLKRLRQSPIFRRLVPGIVSGGYYEDADPQDEKVRELKERLSQCARFPGMPVLIFGASGAGKSTAAERLHALTHGSEHDPRQQRLRIFGSATTEKEIDAICDLIDEGCTLVFDHLERFNEQPKHRIERLLDHIQYRQGPTIRIIGIVELDQRENESALRTKLGDHLWSRLESAGRTLHIPPLRERAKEIRGFVHFWLNQNVFGPILRNHSARVSDEVLTAFENHSTWEHNLRELRGVLQRMCLNVPKDILDRPLDHEIELGRQHLESTDVARLFGSTAEAIAEEVGHLRDSGMTWDEIAAKCDFSRGTAQNHYKRWKKPKA